MLTGTMNDGLIASMTKKSLTFLGGMLNVGFFVMGPDEGFYEF